MFSTIFAGTIRSSSLIAWSWTITMSEWAVVCTINRTQLMEYYPMPCLVGLGIVLTHQGGEISGFQQSGPGQNHGAMCSNPVSRQSNSGSGYG